jgi:iron complex outermembrane receptor protein
MKTKITLFLTALVMFSFSVMAQYKVSGTVKDANGDPISGVSVVVKGTNKGTTTDFDGKYALVVNKEDVLEFSSVGYETVTKVMDGTAIVDVVMAEGLTLDEIVVTGNRSKPRTILDSPVPIDNISSKELAKSGKVQVEQMLTYKVPSFNSQTQPISDATAHFDPADLRGLGPSRTLVLINGKRKNQSSQIYLNGTPGKGEVGIDLKSFPSNAVKRIEVLRDGASAQYGSDAIAGVINIILKDDTEYSEVNTLTGITSKGDGFKMGIDYNGTFDLGEGKINLSYEHYQQRITNRAGEPGLRDIPAAPDVADYGNDPNDPNYIREVTYYNNLVEWVNKHPNIGMIVGQPDLTKNSVLANITYPLGDNTEFYTMHTFTKRKGQSFAYYRAPYWRSDVQAAEFLSDYVDFVGYHPTFETDVLDNMNVAGFKFDMLGLKTDLSMTYGRNYVDYTVNRSVNRDYLADHGTSPRTFHPGGYAFSNFITNLDFSKVFNDKVSTSFGFEYKKEFYKGHKGDELSFYGGGSDSFAGIKDAEAMDVNRSNFAAYAGLDYDFNEDFLLGAAVRYEDFTDFGSNVSWKLNGRYKITDDFVVRASTSTGFRAPTLHQRHIQLTQYIIVAPNPDPQLQGTLPNGSDAVVGLGVPSLKAETSQNFSFGGTAKVGKLNITADVYQIKVNDRVLFSSQIKPLDGTLDGSDPVETILINNGVLALQFFINAVNTKTTGMDLVFDYPNVSLGEGKFGANLAINLNKNEIVGKVANPSALESNGYQIFDHREALRITSARPKSKIALGLNYDIGKFNFALNNTRFGEVVVASGDVSDPDYLADPDLIKEDKDQVLSPKVVTDFVLGYAFSDKFNVTINANNIFDVYPDILWDGTNGNPDLRSAGGRFLYSSEVSQMGQLGANYALKFTMKF